MNLLRNFLTSEVRRSYVYVNMCYPSLQIIHDCINYIENLQANEDIKECLDEIKEDIDDIVEEIKEFLKPEIL